MFNCTNMLKSGSEAESARSVVRMATVVRNRLRRFGAFGPAFETSVCKRVVCRVLFDGSCSGIIDPMLQRMAACGTSSHATRNLHSLIHQTGNTLPVKIATCPARVRLSRRSVREVKIPYPILKPSEWARVIFQNGGHFFLGGNNLDNVTAFGGVLEHFWLQLPAH